ncbi:DUF308 domain-containing protein [Pseudomonadota bacterium]
MSRQSLPGGNVLMVTGVLMIVFGLLAVFSPAATGAAVVKIIALVLLVAGIVRLVQAYRSRGREAITAVAQGFMTAFPDMELVMDKLDMQPEQLVYHWTFIGTNTGPGGTGNAVRFSGYEEWTIGEDGLITRSLGHFDNDEYQRQLEHGVDASQP